MAQGWVRVARHCSFGYASPEVIVKETVNRLSDPDGIGAVLVWKPPLPDQRAYFGFTKQDCDVPQALAAALPVSGHAKRSDR